MKPENEKINEKELFSSFDEASSELIKYLSSFNEEEINTVPFEGSWSAAQVAEHLTKSAKGIKSILSGKVENARRPANTHIEALNSIFLNYSTKSKSAQPLLPSDEPKDKQEVIHKMQTVMDDFKQKAEQVDLSLVCLDFDFPSIGPLTAGEWVHMVTVHTKRHTFQIKNILKALNAVEES